MFTSTLHIQENFSRIIPLAVPPFTVTGILVAAITGVFLLVATIFIGNLINGLAWTKKDKMPFNKSFREMLKGECHELRHCEISLCVFANETYCMATKIKLYWRAGKNEQFIIVLQTDKGCLTWIDYDFLHAEREYSFICKESETAKENGAVSINLFAYKLFDNTLENELKNSKSIPIPGAPAAV